MSGAGDCTRIAAGARLEVGERWTGAFEVPYTGVALDGHDFLDFGASKGGCIDFALRRLGGRKGLGVDNDPKKVAQMRSLGYDCIEGDVTNLNLRARSVRFVTMSHVLEHLPDLEAVRRAVGSAARVSSDFLFIQGPYFDADEALAARGLKFYWSDWGGHTCHVTTPRLGAVLDALRLRDYLIMARVPVLGSADPAIHPLSSPRNQHDYAPDEHPPKPVVDFAPPDFPDPIYREMVCVVRLRRRFHGWADVARARLGCELIHGTLPWPPVSTPKRRFQPGWLFGPRSDRT